MTVANFSDFPAGDPYAEHDLGAIDMAGVGEKILWKIDYYADASCRGFGGPERSDTDIPRADHYAGVGVVGDGREHAAHAS